MKEFREIIIEVIIANFEVGDDALNKLQEQINPIIKKYGFKYHDTETDGDQVCVSFNYSAESEIDAARKGARDTYKLAHELRLNAKLSDYPQHPLLIRALYRFVQVLNNQSYDYIEVPISTFSTIDQLYIPNRKDNGLTIPYVAY